jgi:hypothetical protein
MLKQRLTSKAAAKISPKISQPSEGGFGGGGRGLFGGNTRIAFMYAVYPLVCSSVDVGHEGSVKAKHWRLVVEKCRCWDLCLDHVADRAWFVNER